VDSTDKIHNIVEAYEKALLLGEGGYLPATHSFMREDVILQMAEYMQLFRKAFLAGGWKNTDLRDKRVLEIGCAWGLRLVQLLGFDFQPANMYGIDLLQPYINYAKSNNPLVNYEVMSATAMSFEDRFFDFSFACVSLSAMFDGEVIDSALAEMCRVSKDFVLVIDNFEPSYEDRRNGVLCFKGVDQTHLEKLNRRADVASVTQIGSFWTTSKTSWIMYRALKKIKLESIAYAVAIRMLARHSHKAFLVKMS
jgi:ubiquinone/menaquinone biosynthesis C-methylase UbiE